MYIARSSGLTVAGTPEIATLAAGVARAATVADAAGEALLEGGSAEEPRFRAVLPPTSGRPRATDDWTRSTSVRQASWVWRRCSLSWPA